MTRVLQSDLDHAEQPSLVLDFDYDTGPYQGYRLRDAGQAVPGQGRLQPERPEQAQRSATTTSTPSTDRSLSNSSSLGFGNRRTSSNALNFENSNYIILENIRSIVGEWNSIIGTTMSNSLIVGYTQAGREPRIAGHVLPVRGHPRGRPVYTSFGFEPFTPNNELRYNTFQIQNNFTKYGRSTR